MAGAICPYLGLFDDPETALAYASTSNRCFRSQNPVGVSHNHQLIYCLEKTYTNCPIYLHGLSSNRTQGKSPAVIPPVQSNITPPVPASKKLDSETIAKTAVVIPMTSEVNKVQEPIPIPGSPQADAIPLNIDDQPTPDTISEGGRNYPAEENDSPLPKINEDPSLAETRQIYLKPFPSIEDTDLAHDEIQPSYQQPATHPNQRIPASKIAWWIWVIIIIIFIIFGGIVSIAWGMNLDNHLIFIRSSSRTPSANPSTYFRSSPTISSPIFDQTITETDLVDKPSSTVTQIHTQKSSNGNPPTDAPVIPTIAQPTTVTICYPPSGWVTYYIKSGDTLSSLSRRTGATINQLQSANCMGNSTNLYVNQGFYVPYIIPATPNITRTPTPKPATSTPVNTVTTVHTPVITATILPTDTLTSPTLSKTP